MLPKIVRTVVSANFMFYKGSVLQRRYIMTPIMLDVVKDNLLKTLWHL